MDTCNKADILQRIKEFREYTGMSKSTLATSIGMEQTTLNNQFLGKRGLSIDLVIGVLSSFSELSAEWLLRDRGNMLLDKYSDSPEATQLKLYERIESLVGTIESLQEMIEIKNKIIMQQKDEKSILTNRIQELEQEVLRLSNK